MRANGWLIGKSMGWRIAASYASKLPACGATGRTCRTSRPFAASLTETMNDSTQ